MAGEDEFHDDNPPPPPPPPVTPTQQAPHTLSTIKLPIMKKGEYDIWAMKMEHYLRHTNYPIWEVIEKGNGPVQVSIYTNGQIRVLSPKTAKEILARERERKSRTTLLMSIPEDHLAKFQKVTDAKDMWESIKSRFGDNDESKKMQEYILKQQFKSFSVSPLKMQIRSFLGLYLLLSPKVFKSDIKGSTASSSSTQNVVFVSSKSTNSTNDVSTAYGVSTSSSYNSQKEGSSSYTDELKYSFFANQSSGPQLDHEDLEQLDAKEPVGFDKTKVECFNCHNTGHLAKECKSKGNQESRRRDTGNTGYKAKDNRRRPGKQEEPKALVTLDEDGVDWTSHAEDEQENFSLMAYSNSSSNIEVTSCSKECEESYAKLKKLYDEQREQLGVASIEIQAYTQSLKRFAKVEGMHVVPPPMIRIYMPSKSDFGIDESKFLYGLKQSKTSEFDAKTNDTASCESNSSVETPDSVPKPAINEPTTISKPKVWSDARIIKEYELDSDDEYVIEPSKEQEKTSFAFVNTVKHVKSPKETVKEQNTYSPSRKADKRDWNGLMSKKLGLGYGFTKKACFKGKGTVQEENRPVWNNAQRLNHQNKFVPKAILTKTGIFLVNAARQNPSSQATETSIARKVNTTTPIDDPQKALKNKQIVDNRCSRHMTRNKAYLMCDKKNKVLFTDTECLVLSLDFKLPNENQLCQNSRPKSKNVQVRVNTEESAVKPEPELKNTIGMESLPI
ncbi:ribonuclease H-like domain-containing protein [Tanacetum coccineum]